MIWALLPVKDLARAKTRLSGVLAPHERRRLAQAMLEDVLCALGQVEQLAGVLLVSEDLRADLLAHKYPIEVMTEQSLGCKGLNGVVESATALLAARGATDVMVIHGDLPLVQSADLAAVLAAYREPGVNLLVVPDLKGKGTNLMLYPAATPRPLATARAVAPPIWPVPLPGGCRPECCKTAGSAWMWMNPTTCCVCIAPCGRARASTADIASVG